MIYLFADEPTDKGTIEGFTALAVQLGGADDSNSPFVEGFLGSIERDGGNVLDSSAADDISEVHQGHVRYRCVARSESNNTVCAAWWTVDNISVGLLNQHTGAGAIRRELTDSLPTLSS